MPYVEIPPSPTAAADTEPLKVKYYCSTPTNAEATEIDPSLPTLVFLHPIYFFSSIHHWQFADPALRQYNMIAVDLRIHGGTWGEVWSGFQLEDLADDVSRFITALSLPAVHLVGLSLGASVALWTAIRHPEQVASCVVMSNYSPVEAPEVAAGRAEIAKIWREGVRDKDMTAYNDCAFGSIQLFFGDQSKDRARRIVEYSAMAACIEQWHDVPTCERIRIMGVDAIVERTVITKEHLAEVKAPVLLVHGDNDFAYPSSNSVDMKLLMMEAGVEKVELKIIHDAPHFCSVHSSKQINSLLNTWILSNTSFTPPHPSPPQNVVSPWQHILFPPGDEVDEDADEEQGSCSL